MKILIVDDHTLFREGLTHVLQQLDGEIVTLQASDFDSATRLLDKTDDLEFVLLDLNLVGKSGFDLLAFIREHDATLPVIVVSASRDPKDMQLAISRGAMGFIPKDSSGDLMLSAINVVLAGGIYLPADVNKFQEPASDEASDVLTPRQQEVLSMLVSGDSNKRIASALGITEATTKMHITGIFRALGVTNRTQAVLAAQRLGYDL